MGDMLSGRILESSRFESALPGLEDPCPDPATYWDPAEGGCVDPNAPRPEDPATQPESGGTDPGSGGSGSTYDAPSSSADAHAEWDEWEME